MTQLAKDTGLERESLYKALSGEGNLQCRFRRGVGDGVAFRTNARMYADPPLENSAIKDVLNRKS